MKNTLFLIPLIIVNIFLSSAYGQNLSTTGTIDIDQVRNEHREKDPSNLIIQASLIPDTEAFSFSGGQVYKISDPLGVLVNFHHSVNQTDFNYYPYLSTPNRIDFSENSIRVNFAFKLPVSNITTQIERIDTTFPVTTITNYTDHVTYRGWSSYPITINGTEYQPNIFFVFQNDSPPIYISIENFPP